ncbi:MAG: HD domain-containing protein [Candidatus Gracilibacteria bacterium]|nr:HD domain-containing protein [Candidatus Gracilibacteria bacterium]
MKKGMMDQTEDSRVIRRAKEYVNGLLIPLERHYYHQYSHALEVMERSLYLGKREGLTDAELEMLALAALFHDTGFIIQYDNNEPIGAKIAQNYLKSMLYDREKIEIIESIILATDPKYKQPKNIYEEIIKDADLDNLGRNDFWNKTKDLSREIQAIKNIKTMDPEWQHGIIDFLADHKYYTKTQQDERDSQKKENLSRLEDMLTELEKDSI